MSDTPNNPAPKKQPRLTPETAMQLLQRLGPQLSEAGFYFSAIGLATIEGKEQMVAVTCLPTPPRLKIGMCAGCGCTEDAGCTPGSDGQSCTWLDDTKTLCSNCVGMPRTATEMSILYSAFSMKATQDRIIEQSVQDEISLEELEMMRLDSLEHVGLIGPPPQHPGIVTGTGESAETSKKLWVPGSD